MSSEKYEYVKAERQRKREAGMKLKQLWVWPTAWPAIKAEAKRLNAKAERERK